ncbi:hypothetical protein X769_22085 [Mesorhizobium sp. LSJC268A00]|uniref:hypothetical protein n=1 Tax=unclassified Mesorhizobium TaxID=325217 RepID=UPI0003CF794E|nr:hypothetical protein [Mesorhizobium sp. LSJC268A00]ESX00649.1 hypothetical protein X769_22085 [Mesorhizobium sp. LSJC268A00]
MTSGFEFLGFRFVMHWDGRYGYGPRVEIPKAADCAATIKVRVVLPRGGEVGRDEMAKVALARKLAVVLHQMMRSTERFLPTGRPEAVVS